jgi:uncharacterized protein (TIGR04255 family)
MAPARHRLLKNAPITEAIIDMRVKLAEAFTAEMLRSVRSALEPLFPEVEEQRRVESMMEIMEGRVSHSTSDHGIRGLILRSKDRNEVVQIRDTGFAFSKLRPYTNWQEVFASAQVCWRKYASAVPVEMVQRVAVRYLNQFVVPRSRQLTEYLVAPPAVPHGLTLDAMTSALTRLALHDDRSQIDAILIQVTERVDSGTNVMIDVDSFRAGLFDPSDSRYWDVFEELRNMKNRIFFGSIHELAAQEFDK